MIENKTEIVSFLGERQQSITDLVEKNGIMKVAELSKLFGVSEETIRRDFEKLEGLGLLNRIHGGAIRVEKKTEVPVLQRKEKNVDEKEAIARTAASYVEDGDIIAIDASTTCLYMTKYLTGKTLTVVTNSIGVTLELAHNSNIRVILIGGYLSESSMSLVGNFSQRVIQDYHVDKFFFSCLGVDFKRGVSEIHEEQALVKRQLIGIADSLFLLADHSKFGEKSLFRLCDLKDVDHLVTDNDVSINTIREFRNRGVNVIVGEKSS